MDTGERKEHGGDTTPIKTLAPTAETKAETTPQTTTNRDVFRTLPAFMQRQILACFGYQDFTLAGRTCPYLHALWTEAMENGRMAGTVFVRGTFKKSMRQEAVGQTPGALFAKQCTTLKDAVKKVHEQPSLTTIVLGKGHHKVKVGQSFTNDSKSLKIASVMQIVGDPRVVKEDIIVACGIMLEKEIQGNCHLQHLTLRQAKETGVLGLSSFTMDEVLVEQCGGYGVVAFGTGVVGRCTDVEVRQCGFSGVSASDGASITLIGAKTTVHHNCTKANSRSYGLLVSGSSSSTIQLVAPLTKEQVATDNGGGGNWGDAGRSHADWQITTVMGTVDEEKKDGARDKTNVAEEEQATLKTPSKKSTTKCQMQ